VELLSGTPAADDPRERLELLLIHAMCVVAVGGQDALDAGLSFVARAEELASTGDPVALVHCAKARFFCHYFAGDHARAGEIADAALIVARGAGLRFEECAHLHNAGERHLRLGDPERARVALVASSEIARDIGAEPAQLHNEVLLAYLDERAPRLRELAEGFRAAGSPWHEVYARYWLGRLLSRVGARQDAQRELERALHLAGELKVRTIKDEVAQVMAEVVG
jgi:tetratricopeptide (TPR) repeat protein